MALAAVSAWPGSSVVAGGGQGPGAVSSGANAAATYQAYRNQRSELTHQLDRYQGQRGGISDRLRSQRLSLVDRQGLEQQLVVVDKRIADIESQLAVADANVARAAAVPGAVVEVPPPLPHGPPEEVYVLSGMFMFVVLLPLSIALARRVWRRGAAVVTQIPQDIYDRFSRIDQSLDAIAIEVERLGEGQRYLTKLQADRALAAGPAERVEAPVRDRERGR